MMSLDALRAAYGGSLPEPTRWQLGPLIPGSCVHDTMPTQLVDAPGHPGKIEIHGDDCYTVGRQIVAAMQQIEEGA